MLKCEVDLKSCTPFTTAIVDIESIVVGSVYPWSMAVVYICPLAFRFNYSVYMHVTIEVPQICQICQVGPFEFTNIPGAIYWWSQGCRYSY